ncbi:MAG: hypothetical protein LBM59_05090 [Ruminococcus sp.]|jgi:hypothetical protein|nr:hypothetical protein [Ruminococcus sp.]
MQASLSPAAPPAARPWRAGIVMTNPKTASPFHEAKLRADKNIFNVFIWD